VTRGLGALALSVGVCLAVGALGGLATASSVRTWYPTLAKPSWNPPAWIFGPVWTALYVAMGVAAWLVWRRAGFANARAALAVFGIQLVLNLAWSFLFFGAKSPVAGVVDIALLWAAIVATIVAFARVSTGAAWLLAPYLAWVTFAAALNVASVRLNPGS
jgi:tryptophan-rich sensory protein